MVLTANLSPLCCSKDNTGYDLGQLFIGSEGEHAARRTPPSAVTTYY